MKHPLWSAFLEKQSSRLVFKPFSDFYKVEFIPSGKYLVKLNKKDTLEKPPLSLF